MSRTPTPAGVPFSRYRVTLARDAPPLRLAELASHHSALAALLAGQRSVALSGREAAAFYDAIEALVREAGLPIPLRFTPVRCRRARALPFEAVALSPTEILHLVHDGFYGPSRCREAAIAAVEACGALPVPALALKPLPRRSSHIAAERHVDALIDGEPELHTRLAPDDGGSTA
jgi:hypothetical protein